MSRERSTRRAIQRRSRNVALGGALALGTGALGGCSVFGFPPSSGPTSTQGVLPPQASGQCTPKYGTTPSAIAAAQAALNIPAVLASARTAYGSRFAGWWIDNCGTLPTLNIMVTGTTGSHADTLFHGHMASQATTTLVHYGKYSLAQLSDFVSAIDQYATSYFTSPANSPSSPWIVTVDPQDNAVSITLPHADAKLLAQVQSVVPADALRIQWNDSPAPDASAIGSTHAFARPEAISSQHGPGWEMGATRNTYPPYKAGLYIFSGPPVHEQCTSGFTLEAAGTYYGVTAGHCVDEGSQVDLYQNVAQVGTVVAHSLGTGGDYSVFKLYKQASSDWKGQIIAESNSVSGFVDNVVGRQSDANQGIGLEVCSSGFTTNKVSCGTVTTEFKTIVIEAIANYGVPVGNLMCATYMAATLDEADFVRRFVEDLELLSVSDVSLDSRLIEDLGFDSLQMVETLVWLSEILGDAPTASYPVERFSTLRDIYLHYLEHDSMPMEEQTPRSIHPIRLQGNLVKLIAPMGNHYARLYEIAVSDEIAWRWRYAGAIPNYDDFLRTFSAGVLSQLTITRVIDPQPVGLVVLYNASLQSGTGYLGIVVAPECVGTGVGAEAAMLFLRYVFHTWDLTKVYIESPEFNLAQFASGVGRYFHVEGRLRSHYYYGGRRFDQVIGAVYRDEFLQLIEEKRVPERTNTSALLTEASVEP